MSLSASPEELQDLIRKTAIGIDGPGTILRDVEAALDFVSSESPGLMTDHTFSAKLLI